MVQAIIMGILITAIFTIAAAFRSHTSFIGTRPKKMKFFVTENSVDATKQAVIKFAQYNGYSVVFNDDVNGHIIFEEGIGWTSYGFFYLIYITKQSNTTTLVEIGIESKSIQNYGPIPNRRLDKCVNGIQSMLMLIKNDYATISVQQPTPIEPSKNSKYCTSCGKQMSLESKFCTNCGKLNT